MGILCSYTLKKTNDRESVFLDPADDDILEEHSVEIKAQYTDPNGKKITTSSNPEKESCINFSNHSPDTYVPGNGLFM